jgi:hypothetical protein
MDRLYVVTRSDLQPGAQLAQSCHAVSAFAHLYRAEHDAWQADGQNLVVLSVEDENALGDVLRGVAEAGARVTPFHEPDFGNALTAFAASGDAGRLLSSLPLALRTPRAAARAA